MLGILKEMSGKFKSDYDDSGDCFIWNKFKDKLGYGLFQFRYNKIKYKILAHRAAFMLHYNILLSSDQILLHSCDNPSCVNPLHLSVGTHEDNVMDRVSKERSAIGVDNGRAKLTEDDVRFIKQSSKSNKSLAENFGVSPKAIWFIKNEITWKHISV